MTAQVADATSVVERYLTALGAQDWAALAACLDESIERTGPYNDVYRGRDPYVTFLADTLRALAGYELRVHRLIATATTVVAELSETVDVAEGRRCTEEAVVFDVSGAGRIVRVAVYLRRAQVVAR